MGIKLEPGKRIRDGEVGCPASGGSSFSKVGSGTERRRQRKPHLHPGTLPGRALDPEGSPMGGGDLPRDRKPEPGAVRLGREERIEHVDQLLRGDPAAAVGDHDPGVAPVNVERQARGSAALQRLGRVEQQVEEKLFERHGVAQDPRRLGIARGRSSVVPRSWNEESAPCDAAASTVRRSSRRRGARPLRDRWSEWLTIPSSRFTFSSALVIREWPVSFTARQGLSSRVRSRDRGGICNAVFNAMNGMIRPASAVGP